jgi:hypothetical protein
MQVAAVNSRKLFCFLWSHPKSVMHVQSILWSDRLIIFIPYVIPSTLSHWLICSMKRSSFLRANHMTYERTSLSVMLVPNQNSIVFYCKISMWSRLSSDILFTRILQASSYFGACYRSSSPESSATSSRWFVLQTFFFRHAESDVTWHQPDLNLRHIWWLEHFTRIKILVSL